MVLKLKYHHHNHSVCLLAYHFVTCTKKRKPELEGISLDLFKQALKKYLIEIHVGEIMLDHISYSSVNPSTSNIFTSVYR